MKKKNLLYIAAVMLILLFPLVGMPLFGSDWTTETTDLAPAPELKKEDGSLNTAYLSDAGAYFEDHFALRSNLITANSLLQAKVFRTSASKKITVGNGDWLYFNGDMDDYQRENAMSDRELYNVAHNISLIRDYYELLGMKFVFTISPNKTTLYPENLPSNMIEGEGETNTERLIPYLEELDIPYVDLFELFENQEEVLYFAQDSHWNNKGAVLVYNTLMEAAGAEGYETYADAEPVAVEEHSGDLAEMLYPEKVVPEMDYEYPLANTWSYVETDKGLASDAEEEDINMTSYIQTSNPEGKGNLYMFRDSFGASLVPFFAQAFENAVFCWKLPYELTDAVVQGADTVIMECVERNIDYIAEYGVSLPALNNGKALMYQDAEYADADSDPASIQVIMKNGMFEISGSVSGSDFEDDTDLVIRITTPEGVVLGTYDSFYISEAGESGVRISDNGYRVNVMGDVFTGELVVDLLSGKADCMEVVASQVVDFDEV